MIILLQYSYISTWLKLGKILHMILLLYIIDEPNNC